MKSKFTKYSSYGIITLMILSWIFIIRNDGANLKGIFNSSNVEYSKKFFGGLLGKGEEVPAFKDVEIWKKALKLTWETVLMSIIAIGLATIGAVIFVLPASRNIAEGKYSRGKKFYKKPLYFISKALFIVTRSVPELLWATILVFIFKPGIFPGALALALHNFGILGKLSSELIEDMDERPLENLSVAGATESQILVYGIIPAIMPKFINYIFYRWEIIIRSSIVVGFVGAGGLGQAFKLAMSFLKYSEIMLYLICYIALVYIVDFISSRAKKYIREV